SPGLDVEATVQLAFHFQVCREVDPGRDALRGVDRIRDLYSLLERRDSLRPALQPADCPQRDQDRCSEVFEPETLGQRQGLLRVRLPRGLVQRGLTVGELREDERLRP